MSLYDDVARNLASVSSVTASADRAIGGAMGGLGSSISNALGGGKLAQAVGTIGGGMLKNAAMGAVNRAIPQRMVRDVTAGVGIAGSLMQGDFEGAGLRLLDSGLLRDFLPGMDGVVSQLQYWGTPTPLFGGITPAEAQRIHQEIVATRWAKKNLFLIEVSSDYAGDFSDRFNLFATDLSYAPLTIAGEKRRVGAASVDLVSSAEPVEMRVTTKDDEFGTLRRWFQDHCALAASPDGTVGVPQQYAIRIKVVHSFITRDSNYGGYEEIGLFRPVNLETELSRRDDNLEEVQMSFTQLDTFMAP